MASGERRLAFLDEKIDRLDGSRGSLNFDRAERLFIREALRALELYYGLLSEQLNPVTALRNVLHQLEQLGLPSDDDDHLELRAAVARAKAVLVALKGVIVD
jgi:hypothetical protein